MPRCWRAAPVPTRWSTFLPRGRYFVSVLSPNHYSIGGGPVRPGQTEVNIVVNKFPVPLAQITVLVFRDNAPINGAPDIPNETPLGGLKVFLFDQLGQQSQDAFGNPIGTIYQSDPVDRAADPRCGRQRHPDQQRPGICSVSGYVER